MKAGPAIFDLDGFEYFWSCYPRKENKLQARKAWAKLRPVPNSMLIEAIKTWVEIAAQSRQWAERSFIPHASTFIRQRRWEGDPPPPDAMRARAIVGYNPTPSSYQPPPCGQEAAHALGCCDCGPGSP